MVNESKAGNTIFIDKTVVCGEIYFYCKINGILVWCFHQNDLPSKYKDLAENIE